jgi:hypothetical protein
MEYQRAYRDERPNQGLMAHFDAQVVPLIRERRRYAGSARFRLYDVVEDGGRVIEDVFAYTNGAGADRSMVVYHNRFASAAGWIRDSVAYAVKQADGSKTLQRDTLASALELGGPDDGWLRLRDRRGARETLRSVGELRSTGLFVQLDAYGCLVIDSLAEVASTADEPWAALAAELGGAWVPSLDDALADLRLRPVHDEAAAVIVPRDPAATALALEGAIEGLDRARFDALRLATPLGRAGFGDAAVRRTRLAIGLPHPATSTSPAALADAWLADPDLVPFLEVHDWEGRTWLNGERWTELLDLAESLDRATGRKGRSPVAGRLRTAAATAGYDVAKLREALAVPASVRGAVCGEARKPRTRR